MTDEVTDLRIEQFRIRNYRVLRDVVLKDITPLTVLCGPNGSGKSTVIDVFAFLHTAFTTNLRRAWDERNRLAEIRSRGQEGPVGIEIQYRTNLDGTSRLATYSLELGESRGIPVVQTEKLRWTIAPGSGEPKVILDFSNGRGSVFDEVSGETRAETLTQSDSLAVSALGQLSRHPRVTALRDFISGWHLSYVNVSNLRNTPTSGPSARLSQTGDNLANVLQYLGEQHPDRLSRIFTVLSQRVPRLEKVLTEPLPDGRLLLRLKDRPFKEPVLAKFTSDGTLKLLAYLTVLYDPDPPKVIGIEEPENQLHPRLLPILAEEARGASARSQLLVTTHSPEFVDALRANELWSISRGPDGFASVSRASDASLGSEHDAQRRLPGRPMAGRVLGCRPLISRKGPGMTELTLEVLVEDRSTEHALRHLIPRISPECQFNIRSFDRKHALMKRLQSRLEGYADHIRYDPSLRVIVIVDLDDEDCHDLKKRLEHAAEAVGLLTLSSAQGAGIPTVATRIAIEELEAWFIGDFDALRAAYPRVPQSLAARKNFRVPDDVRGGTWETLERLLQSFGYHAGGLRKIALADEVAQHMDIENNRSASFRCLRDGIRSLTSWKVA